MKTFAKLSSLVAGSFLLAACSTPAMYGTSSHTVDTTQKKIQSIDAAQTEAAKPASSVIVKNGLYVGQQRIDLKHEPAWLSNTITLHGDQLPFSFYSRNIVRNNHVLTHYQEGLDPSVMITMNYTGTLKGALDMLAAKTGYIYQIDGDHIYWQAFVTRTFNIAFMPGSSNYLVGKDQGSNQNQGNAGSDSNTIVSQGNGQNDTQNQYSNLAGKLSVWDDLKATIQAMLSPQGKIIISESTTTLTVKDRPDRVNQIARYIKKINYELSQQVMLKVQVFQVTLSNSFNNGVNWNVVSNFIRGTKFQLLGNFSQPIAISPIGGTTQSGGGFTNNSGASFILYNALSQQGKVSIATEPTVVTTNNQVASINITSTVGYLAELQNTTSTAQQQGAQTTTTITPGKVVTGLTLYVLPKIMDGKVYLQISSDLSSLVDIRNLFATGSDTSANASSQKIQVPDIDEKEFNQRGVIKSGATLILAGFKQLSNQTNAEQMFGSQTLGGKGAQRNDVETIVLITPYVLNSDE